MTKKKAKEISKMNYYGKTDIGKKRVENQDCFGYKELDGMTVLAVCDGMGGAKGGATASRLALASFLSICERDLAPDIDDRQIRTILSRAVAEANSAVLREAAQNSELAGMGSTLVASLITENDVFIINVGDSRAYTATSSTLEQVSHDHSYVQLLIDLGSITPEEAESHPDRHVIMKAIGASETLTPDIDKLECDRPSYILLCTDGLTGMVKADVIKEVMLSPNNLNEKIDRLIALANENGGEDNITVLGAEL